MSGSGRLAPELGALEPGGPVAVIVMGVSGSGKTTLGKALAARLGWEFQDADDWHPPANIAKMAAGTPLDDADRAPWLAALNRLIAERLAGEGSLILACSALKQAYRDELAAGHEGQVRFVHIVAGRGVLRRRLEHRRGHYMPASLLESQLATLEPPKGAISLNTHMPLRDKVELVVSRLGRGRNAGANHRRKA